MLAKGDGTVANVTSAGELDTLLCALNGDCAMCQCVVVKSIAGVTSLPDSDRADRSLVILENSELGMEMVAAYSVSGYPSAPGQCP